MSPTNAPGPIPSGTQAVLAVGTTTLEPLLGQTVTEFCGKYGKVADSFNHCAHFVSHVLTLRVHAAALCSNVDGSTYPYEDRRNGFCIRVNQVFNATKNRRRWTSDDKPGKCLIVATIKDNIFQTDPVTIGDQSKKHIGFFVNGTIYHYSNTKDRVIKQSLGDFKNHFGAATVLLMADLP
jgi:hypothetical protein